MDPTQQGGNPTVEPVQPAPVQPVEMKDKSREQFEKLLESNKRLYESNLRLQEEIKARQTPVAPKQQSATVDANDFFATDPETGEQFVYPDKLAEKIKFAEQEAAKANQQVQKYIEAQEKKEIERQNREAMSAYPELNPDNAQKFDREFSRQVRAVLTDSMYVPEEYGGKPLSFKEAADFVRSSNPKPQTQPAPSSEEAEAQKQAAQDLKQQSAAGVTSQPQVNAQHFQDEEEEIQRLRFKTRFGDDKALAERIKHTPHILPKDAQVV